MRPPPQKTFLDTSNPCTTASAPIDLEAEIREIQNRLNNLSRERQIYPFVEVTDLQGQRIRQHNPLAFKDIKQLKEAAMAYGTHAPFTVDLMKSFVEPNLTPSDLMQLCRAFLLGGDYLL